MFDSNEFFEDLIEVWSLTIFLVFFFGTLVLFLGLNLISTILFFVGDEFGLLEYEFNFLFW